MLLRVTERRWNMSIDVIVLLEKILIMVTISLLFVDNNACVIFTGTAALMINK